jgi:hypothetical protein
VVRRIRALVGILLLIPLVGSGVTWTLAVRGLGHGAHHVSLQSAAGRLAVVLEHGVASHSAHDHDAGDGMSHSHDHHDHHEDHVVVLAAADPCSTTAPQQVQRDHGPAVALTRFHDSSSPRAALLPCRACSRVGPPVPSRSSILRI